MNLLANTSIDFMGRRRIFVPFSVALMVASAVLLFTGNLNWGIDFVGGTQLIVKFSEPPEVDELRDQLAGEGYEEPPILQRFGAVDDHEVIIKTRVSSELAEGSRGLVTASLNRFYNAGDRGFDLNQEGSASISDFLLQRDPDAVRTLGNEEAFGTRLSEDPIAKPFRRRLLRNRLRETRYDLLVGRDLASELVVSG